MQARLSDLRVRKTSGDLTTATVPVGTLAERTFNVAVLSRRGLPSTWPASTPVGPEKTGEPDQLGQIHWSGSGDGAIELQFFYRRDPRLLAAALSGQLWQSRRHFCDSSRVGGDHVGRQQYARWAREWSIATRSRRGLAENSRPRCPVCSGDRGLVLAVQILSTVRIR